MDLLFKYSIEGRELVMITLKSKKIYVGYVMRISRPRPDNNYFSINPVMSGYRKSENHELVITTDYLSAYEELMAGKEVGDEGNFDVELVIKRDEVETCTSFNSDLFNRFQKDQFEPEGEINS